MIRHFLTKEFLRFLAVGSSAAIINWITRITISTWVPFSIAIILSYFLGMCYAFILNKIFVFPGSNRETKKQIRDFLITNAISLPIVWSLSLTLKSLLENELGFYIYSEEIAHLLALSAPMLMSFSIYKFIAFSHK